MNILPELSDGLDLLLTQLVKRYVALIIFIFKFIFNGIDLKNFTYYSCIYFYGNSFYRVQLAS